MDLRKKHHATDTYIHDLRIQLNQAFPNVTFSFLPADIVNQILKFGLPSVIDIQIMGVNPSKNHDEAVHILNRIQFVPGVIDAHLFQSNNYPALRIETDRSRALELGFTQSDIATNVLISLSGSFQIAPNFWEDPKSGVSYNLVSQTPQYQMQSLQALRNIPITSITHEASPQILGALANISRTGVPSVVSHFNVQPVADIFASVEGRDLSAVVGDIQAILDELKPQLPKGMQVFMKGQAKMQQESFHALYAGLLFAVILVYLVIVINFQSWTDALIIISALPAALAGIVWMLFLTHTPLSVPALTGAIMCMGVATANSILVINFARDHLKTSHEPMQSALEAGVTRLRPDLMTARAMIVGMLPMALGFGEGSEQNAPLGRAVIGGLLFATLATLLFVPALFCFIHNKHRQGSHHA